MPRFDSIVAAARGWAHGARNLLSGFVLLLGVSVLLAGCGARSGLNAGTPPESAGVGIQGEVHGGQQPVSGAEVYLFAASTGGYAKAPAPLLTNPVVTGNNGSFSITGDWSCPAAPGDQVFLVATGGNPGNSGNQVNPNLVMMAALGSCSGLTSSTFITMNEVTTVASAYALASFFTYADAIDTLPTATVAAGTVPNIGIPAGGGSCTAAAGWLSTGANTCGYTGLKNAFATANALANLARGTAQAGTAAYVLPQAELDTLASILTACVSSTGGVANDGSNCGKLFGATTPGSTGVAPTDTLQAILNLARNPRLSAVANSSFFSLLSANGAFLPVLSTAPQDWTLPITLSGGGLDGPTALGIGATGNVWTVNYYGALSSFTPGGVPVFPSGITGYGLNESFGMTIDPSGNVWTANQEVAGGGPPTSAPFLSSPAMARRSRDPGATPGAASIIRRAWLRTQTVRYGSQITVTQP